MSSGGKQMQAAPYKVVLDRWVGQKHLYPKMLLA